MTLLSKILTQYRRKFETIGRLWSSLFTSLGQEEVDIKQHCHDMVESLEGAVDSLLTNEIRAAQKRHTILNLKQALAISQLAVDAKSRHLDLEEEDKDRERQLRYQELQATCKLDDQRAALELDVGKPKEELSALMQDIEEKSERQRHLEAFHEWLVKFSASDIKALKEKSRLAREDRSVWDMDDLDVSGEIKSSKASQDEITALDKTVTDLKKQVHNYRAWYDEELQTKLFYCSRSNEMKKRIEYLASSLHRINKESLGEPVSSSEDNRQSQLENELVDGFNTMGIDLPPMKMRKFLSEHGVNVTSDLVTSPRFKDVIRDMSLSYLMDKTREQSAESSRDVTNPGGKLTRSSVSVPNVRKTKSRHLDSSYSNRISGQGADNSSGCSIPTDYSVVKSNSRCVSELSEKSATSASSRASDKSRRSLFKWFKH